ncbi:efflux RND transporter periplasmic adaptor subunit [Planctomycetaceae bacterium SH139]
MPRLITFQVVFANRVPLLSLLFSPLLVTQLLAQAPPANVELGEVLFETVEPKQDFVGTAQPLRRSLIGSAVDGRVEIADIDAGQRVSAGDELAKLRIKTISIEIEGAKAEADLRQAELQELKNGALPEEIARAEAQLAAANALATYARARVERTQDLSKAGGAISRQELELAVSEFQSTQQQVIAAEETLKLLKQGPRAELIAQAEARLEAQVQRVTLLEDRKTKYDIKAPFDGFIVRKHTEVGAWIKQGDPIVEMIDLGTMEIEVQVPEASVPFLRIGMDVAVRVEAFPEVMFAGTLAQIISEANVRTRTFPVRVRVANQIDDPAKLIRAGMLARADLPAGPKIDAWTVHKDALVFNGGTPVVYVADKGVAKLVPVRLLVESGERAAVQPLQGEFREGDKVVTLGNERLRPNQEIVELGGSGEPRSPAAAGKSPTTGQ